MKKRLAISFPYLCAILIIGLIILGNLKSDVVVSDREPIPHDMPAQSGGVNIDPVCLMQVGESIALKIKKTSYFFCCDMCRDRFEEDPAKFLNASCLVCRIDKIYTPIEEDNEFPATWLEKTYHFCSEDHRAAFRADPAGYFMHTMWGIPNWLYYCSIAFILVLSFGIFEVRAASDKKIKAPAEPIRINLMKINWLRKLIIHPASRFMMRLIVAGTFILIICAGLFGSQLPSKNIAPFLTWTVWWGGLIILILYAGKAWCYVCPWDALSDWAEGLRFWGAKKEGLSLDLKWPKMLRNIWPAIILFVGLTWIEIGFGVTMNPRATAWLALTMLGMTFVSAFLFDRRSFCRYGCLVGRISGLYALFSPVEVRNGDPEVCRTCKTHSCFKGNECGEACPTSQYLATMNQNTYCISCMECAKSCEVGNVSLNLRPWGEDLKSLRKPRSDEAWLALLMLSLTAFHGLTMTAVWRSAIAKFEAWTGLGQTMSFSISMLILMLAPGVLYAALVALSRWAARESTIKYKDYFIRYAYALLPIALFYHLAHNSEHLLMEGQKIVPMLSDPFGYQWNIFGTAEWSLAPITNLPTLWVIQVFLVMVGHIYSLWVARNAARGLFQTNAAARRSQYPMLVAMILFSLMSLWLLKQPMEMRTSAM